MGSLRYILLLCLSWSICSNGFWKKIKKHGKKAVKSGKKAVKSGSDLKKITGSLTNVLSELDDIADFLDEQIADVLTDILNDVKSIPKAVTKMMKIPNFLKSLTKGIKKKFGRDVLSLANTLNKCTQKMAKLLPMAKILKLANAIPGLKDVPIPFVDDLFPGFDDVTDIMFTILAATMFPLKPAIQFVCNDIVPTIIESFNELLKSMVNLRRRRVMNEEVRRLSTEQCVYSNLDELCEIYDDDDDWPSGDNYDEMTRFASELIADSTQFTDAETIQGWRVAQFVLGMVYENGQRVADAFKELGDVGVGAGAAAKPIFALAIDYGPPLFVLRTALDVVNYAMECADFHDDVILTTKVNSIYENNKIIIHNQQVLKTMMLPMMDEPTPNGGNNGEIILKIGIHDLYIIGIFIIGFNIAFIVMAVNISLKCCNGSNSSKTPKYDYSASEVENIRE